MIINYGNSIIAKNIENVKYYSYRFYSHGFKYSLRNFFNFG